jgi:hypothetical protein
MSIRAMAQVFDFAPQAWTSAERLVALVIADHVGDSTGECWPSVQRISERSGVTPRQVQRILTRLEAYGVIERRPRFDNNRQTTNVYVWHNLYALAQNVAVGDDIAATPRGDLQDTPEGGLHVVQNHHKNPQLNPQSNH